MFSLMHLWWWVSVELSPDPLPRWKKLGRAGTDGIMEGGEGSSSMWLDAAGHGGTLVASQGLPLCLRRTECCRWAVMAAGLPSLRGNIGAALLGQKKPKTFWEGVYSFLAWKPFGRCFDLHFHFFFMLLERARSKQRG